VLVGKVRAQEQKASQLLTELRTGKDVTEGMPATFQLAAKPAGKRLLTPQGRAYGLAQRARAEAHERLEQWDAAPHPEPSVPASRRAKTGSSGVVPVSVEEDRQLEEVLK